MSHAKGHKPPRRPPSAPTSHGSSRDMRTASADGGRMPRVGSRARKHGLASSGPVSGSFRSTPTPPLHGHHQRRLRPRTASSSGAWGASYPGAGGGSFMTQAGMMQDDDSTSTLPLFVELGSPHPQDRVQTQRQMRWFENVSRTHREQSVSARQRVMGNNEQQFNTLYEENCKQQAEMDAVEQRLMNKEAARRNKLVHQFNKLVAKLGESRGVLKKMSVTLHALKSEFEAGLEDKRTTEAALEEVHERIERDKVEIERHKAYAPQLQHMLVRLQALSQEDLQMINEAKGRLHRGKHDLATLSRIEQQLTSTSLETHQELEKWNQMRQLDRQLRGRGLEMRQEILDRQQQFNRMAKEREAQRELVRRRVLRGSGQYRRRLSMKKKARAQENDRAELLKRFMGKKVSFRIGSEEHSVADTTASFERMSVATGVSITTPVEALERISSQGPREQQLTQEIEALEQAIEKAKATALRKQQEMDTVREKYNGVGFQIARTTLDDYRRRLDVAIKNEVRTKETMLATLELLSTVRVGVDMLESRLDGVSLPASAKPQPSSGSADKTQTQLRLITAKIRHMKALTAQRRKTLQARGVMSSSNDASIGPGMGSEGGVPTGPLFAPPSAETAPTNGPAEGSAAAPAAPQAATPAGKRSVTFATSESGVGAATGSGSLSAKASMIRGASQTTRGRGRGKRRTPSSANVASGSTPTANAGDGAGTGAGKDGGTKTRRVPGAPHSNNIRVGPLTESTSSLPSVTSLELFDLNDSDDSYVDQRVADSDDGERRTPNDRQAPFRRLAEHIKDQSVRVVEDAERRVRKEQRRARMLERRATVTGGRDRGNRRRSMSPHPPSNVGFSASARRGLGSTSRRERFLRRGHSTSAPRSQGFGRNYRR